MGPQNKPLLHLDDFELKAIKINFNLFLNYQKETREGPVPEKNTRDRILLDRSAVWQGKHIIIRQLLFLLYCELLPPY